MFLLSIYFCIWVSNFIIQSGAYSFEFNKRQKFFTQQSIYSNVKKVTNIQTKVNATEYMKYSFYEIFILDFHNRNKQSIYLII
jgi:hypothetical protein